MKRAAAVAVAVVLLLAGCGDPPPTEGYVRAKKFEPAHWEGGYEPYTTVEMRCHSEYDYGSKTTRTVCGSEPVTHYRWEDHHNWVGDRWKLKLEDCKPNDDGKRKCRTGWLTVDQEDYHSHGIGSHYPDPK